MEFDALVQCKSNALEHRQRMSFVIGIFQACDHWLLGADSLGQFGLS